MAIDTLGANALASNSVTTAKIANDAVTGAKIPANAVVAADIADGSVTTAKLADNAVTSAKSDNLGRRNMVINGAMQIAQRGTDIDDIATDGQKNMDMFVTRDYGGNGTYDFDQSTDVPDETFYYSMKLTVKSASTNTGSYGYAFEHRIEGYNMSRLRLGRSTARPITVSFWVKSSVAGTYNTGLRTTNGETSFVKEITLSANTWTYITYTAPAQTATLSALNETNGLGLIVDVIGLGKQTSKTTSTLNAWHSGNYLFSSNQVAWMDNANATLFVTGLQVESGNSATEFEHRNIAEELSLCKRYYEEINPNKSTYYATGVVNSGGSSPTVFGPIVWEVEKRANPAVTYAGTPGSHHIVTRAGSSNAGMGTITFGGIQTKSCYIQSASSPSAMTTGYATVMGVSGSGRIYIDASI
jgi:hypothetical protein